MNSVNLATHKHGRTAVKACLMLEPQRVTSLCSSARRLACRSTQIVVNGLLHRPNHAKPVQPVVQLLVTSSLSKRFEMPAGILKAKSGPSKRVEVTHFTEQPHTHTHTSRLSIAHGAGITAGAVVCKGHLVTICSLKLLRCNCLSVSRQSLVLY